MNEPLRELHRRWENPPPDLVGKLPRAGIQLDYLGHAAVTRALLEADPEWEWEPLASTDDNLPLITHKGNRLIMWIRLTVCGVMRLGCGTCPDNKADPEKELIGDALRNAAMRFGVGLSLWAKEEWHDLDEPAQIVDPVDVDNNAGSGDVGTTDTGSTPPPISQAEAIKRPILRGEIKAMRDRLDEAQKAKVRDYIAARGDWMELSVDQLGEVKHYIELMSPPDNTDVPERQIATMEVGPPYPVTKAGKAKHPRVPIPKKPPEEPLPLEPEPEPADG